MTGHNHYSNCTCGWCVNYGRAKRISTDYRQDFRVRDAKLLLKQRAANSFSGCFVNPNAKCPECGDPVFFYANSAGSRVFFDHLGPPWPKHWCTDRSVRARRTAIVYSANPSLRDRGETKELLAAANTVGMLRHHIFGNRSHKDWTLVVVQAVDRRGKENRVECEFVDSSTNEAFGFTCYSELPVFSVGDLLSVKGDRISLIDRDTLQSVEFTAGTWVRTEPLPAKEPAPSPRVSSKRTNGPKQGNLIRSTKGRKRAPSSTPGSDMTEAEMKHFDNKHVPFAKLFSKLEPAIKSYAREGTRKPKHVAVRLTSEGFRTADGAKWTPRLVYLLLALMFNEAPRPKVIDIEAGALKKRARRPSNQDKSDPSPLSLDEMAVRLSHLGKVRRNSPDTKL
nr:hypothetical protein RFYW14_01175 [Pseudorhizobium flavum]